MYKRDKLSNNKTEQNKKDKKIKKFTKSRPGDLVLSDT